MPSIELKKIHEFRLPTAVLGAAADDDGTHLLAACMDGIYYAALPSGDSERIDAHQSYCSSVAFLNGGTTAVSGGYDGCVHWLDLQTGTRTNRRKLHEFWSWDLAVSPDRQWCASVTGQYLAGGYKYEPAPEKEPCVRLMRADDGEVIHNLSHTPSVQAVTFSPDSRHVAAGNLMGEVRIWNCQSGELVADFKSDDFTSWGIIKSHCYLGGIFSLRFSLDGKTLLMAGMGPMRDPMAGNGRQLWQAWSWQDGEPTKIDETHKGESGEGLMEALAFHPSGELFAMGGRLRGGDWNMALFNFPGGNRLTTLKTGYRITELIFAEKGSQLIVAGTQGQPNRPDKEGRYPDFGRVEIYELIR